MNRDGNSKQALQLTVDQERIGKERITTEGRWSGNKN